MRSLKKREVVFSNFMDRAAIERHNLKFRENVPLGSEWEPRNVVPGIVNAVCLKIQSYSGEGYVAIAVYSDSTSRTLTIPYEEFEDLYVKSTGRYSSV